MKLNINKLMLSLLILTLTSCGADEEPLSEAEQEQRQSLALDLSGGWVSESADMPSFIMEIENEFKKHNVRVELSLGREFTSVERQVLMDAIVKDEPRISEEELKLIIEELHSKLQNFVLGEGKGEFRRGGENVALDTKGDLSEIVVKASPAKFYSTNVGGVVQSYEISASLFMTAHRDSKLIDYRMTSNTDEGGSYLDEGKGFFITIKRINSKSGSSDCKNLLNGFKINLENLKRQ